MNKIPLEYLEYFEPLEDYEFWEIEINKVLETDYFFQVTFDLFRPIWESIE